jgi:hypothetical protein
MTETISNANAAASTLFLGHNGEWWDFWLIVSVVAAALVATAIGVTTAGSIISHKREAASAEQEFALYKLTVDAKVADAKKDDDLKTALLAALDSANIKATVITIKAAEQNTTSAHFQPNAVYLLVGAKPQ